MPSLFEKFKDDFAGRVEQLIYVSVGRGEQEGRQTLPGETASKILHWFLAAPNFSQRKLHILTNQEELALKGICNYLAFFLR